MLGTVVAGDPSIGLTMSRAEIRPDERFAWLGPSLFVVDEHGRADGTGALTGYWFRETRYLRRMRLRVNGETPHLCALGSSDHRRLELVLLYPELTEFGGGGSGASQDTETFDRHGVLHRSIDLRVVHEVGISSLYTSVVVANRSHYRARLDLRLDIETDFADLLDVLGGRRPQRGPIRVAVDHSHRSEHLELRQMSRALPYRTLFDAPGAALDHDGATWSLLLPPRATATLEARVRAIDYQHPLGPSDAEERLALLERWRRSQTYVDVRGSGSVPLAVARAIEDLRSFPLLDGASPREWLALQAGVPLYPALFGRDTLTAGWQASFLDQGAVLDASLTRLGGMQSHRVRDFTDEEPGRIPYQVRTGSRSRLGEEPFGAYYADFATPLMYVICVAQLFAWRGDARQIAPHLDVARGILD